MAAKSTLLTLLIAAFAAFVYQRTGILYTFYANAPQRLPRVNTFKSHEIKFTDRIRNCEDVLLIEEKQVAICACDDGREMRNVVMGVYVDGDLPSARLYAYSYAQSGSDADTLKEISLVNYNNGTDFHTLGMAYDEKTSSLFVANHAKSGSRLELFKLDVAELTATHVRSISHPLLNAPNAINILGDNEIYVSNDHYVTTLTSKVLSLAETYLSPPGGSVVHVKLDGDRVDAKVVARLPFANGVEVINKTTVAVSATSRAAVYLYSLEKEGDFSSLKYAAQIAVPFAPDNLSLTREGKLMIAGHPQVAILAKYAETRHICYNEKKLAAADDEMKRYCETVSAPSWVVEWTEEGGLKDLYVGMEYASSVTAVRDTDRGVGVIVGLYAKGMLVWKD